MSLIARLEHWFVRLNQALIVALMAGIVILVFANVVARYGFGASFGWAEEVSRFAMIWITFLGVGLALRYGQLVTMDAVQSLLPPFGRRLLRWLSALLVLAFLFALLWLGIEFVVFSWRNQTAVLRIPRGVPYLAVPIGAAFVIIHWLLVWRRFVSAEFEPFIELEREAGEGLSVNTESTARSERAALNEGHQS